MWTYEQHDGELTHNGDFVGTGYSGMGSGRNNGMAQHIPNIGPIPCGQYKIAATRDEIPGLGPCVMNLDPTPGTQTFGRSLFRIHGDNKNHDASHGCIILGPTIRHLIANSGDHDLIVIT